MANNRVGISIQEDTTRLAVVQQRDFELEVDAILRSLKQDSVVLITGANAEQADYVMHEICSALHLADSLAVQAGFAGFKGHRCNIGKYFMSVNKRKDYQFIPPHSEGSSFIGMQLAAFFCYKNSTDGGETILMNIDDCSEAWRSLRESVRRGKLVSGSLAPKEVSRVRALYNITLPADAPRDDDQILEERPTDIPGLTILNTLAKPKKTYSCILERSLYVLWDSIASMDSDSAMHYGHLLRGCGLLREPQGGMELHKMDATYGRHLWQSGVDYSRIFKCKITRKLTAGDLIILNNLTWTHSASNWSPDSGTRKIAAAFA